MANPFPFVAGDVLTAAELNGINEKTTFTPTFTNLTIGNGTVLAYYFRVQNVVTLFAQVTFGTTTAITGNVLMSLPISRALGRTLNINTVHLFDVGTSSQMGTVVPESADVNSVAVRGLIVSGTTIAMTSLTSTYPFTWGNSDILQVNYQYEVA